MMKISTNSIAQRINNPAIGNLGNQPATQFFGNLISSLISLGLVIGTLVFMFILLLGGIQWITSGGDKVNYEAARQKITNALVGLLILFSFFAILNLVECFFGIGLRRITIGPFNIGFTNASFCNSGSPQPIPNCGQEGDPCGALGQQCCPGLECVRTITGERICVPI